MGLMLLGEVKSGRHKVKFVHSATIGKTEVLKGTQNIEKRRKRMEEMERTYKEQLDTISLPHY